MKMKELQGDGAFVNPDESTKKTVTWKGKTFDVLIRQSSWADVELRVRAPDEQSKSALTISQSVVLADTGEPFPYEMAAKLKPSLMRALLKAVQEVNDEETEEAAKN